MKVEIDADTADGITRCSLKQSIAYIREDIANIKKKKKLEYYQKHELAELIIIFRCYGKSVRLLWRQFALIYDKSKYSRGINRI